MLVARALFGILLFSAGAWAEKPWTLDAIMNIPALSGPQIAPDGSSVAYMQRTVNIQRNAYDSRIWVIPSAGGSSSKPLPEAHFSDHHPSWSPDGSRLAFLSSRDGVAQIYVADLRRSASRKLTSSPSAITSFAWAPSGNAIGYLASDAPAAQEAERIQRGDDAIVADQGYNAAKPGFVRCGSLCRRCRNRR
jgi:dipeptidyl aminopeptidase/acylaminoacyl peptidase